MHAEYSARRASCSQLARARRLGIHTPRTVVTNDVVVLRGAFTRCVLTPLGPAQFTAEDGQEHLVYATADLTADGWARVHPFLRNRAVYAAHFAHLFRPGYPPPLLPADTNRAGGMASWSDKEIDIALEEARRHHDRVPTRLTDIRARAQYGFAVGLALMTLMVTHVADAGHGHSTALVMLLWAALR